MPQVVSHRERWTGNSGLTVHRRTRPDFSLFTPARMCLEAGSTIEVASRTWRHLVRCRGRQKRRLPIQQQEPISSFFWEQRPRKTTTCAQKILCERVTTQLADDSFASPPPWFRVLTRSSGIYLDIFQRIGHHHVNSTQKKKRRLRRQISSLSTGVTAFIWRRRMRLSGTCDSTGSRLTRFPPSN